MKFLKEALLLALIGLLLPTAASATVAHEVIYMEQWQQAGWGDQHNALCVTATGSVYAADLHDAGALLQSDPAALLDRLSLLGCAEITDGEAYGDTTPYCALGQLTEAELQTALSLRGALGPDALTGAAYETEGYMCDYGVIDRYAVCVWETDGRPEQQIIRLSTYGDDTGENPDPAALAFDQYMQSLLPSLTTLSRAFE